MAATVSAREMARIVSKALGRTVNDKRVRAWVRDNIAAYDDEGYTAHAYGPLVQRTILAGMTGKAKGARSTAAVKGRAKAATPRKATPKVAAPGPETPSA